MYSIQEPCIGVIAGIFAGIFRIRSKNTKTNVAVDIVLQQIIYILFSSICYVALIMWLSPVQENKMNISTINAYKYTALMLLTLFMVLMEVITLYQIVTNKDNQQHLLLFIYGTSLVVLLMEIFSFLLGPISAIEYYKYIHNGRSPTTPGFEQFGAVIYLIPRVIVQCIKTPLESILFVGIIWSLNPSFNNILNGLKNKWDVNN